MSHTLLEVDEDEERYWGHAQLRFRGPLNLSGTVQLIITRNADEPYLGAGGWQTAPTSVEATVISSDVSETVLLVKPEVCDYIPFELQIKIEIKDTGVFGRTFWPSIPPSLSSRLSPFTPLPTTAPATAEPPALAEATETAIEIPPPDVAPAHDNIAVKPKRRLWPLVAGLLTLLLILGLGVAGYHYREPAMAVINRYLASNSESLTDKFARLKAEGAGGDEFYALGHEAFDASNTPIGVEAMNLAVMRGSKRAKLETAQWYDPLSFAADRVPVSDANRAARSYFELAVEGDAAALQRLQNLCSAARQADASRRADFAQLLTSTYCEGSIN